VATSLLLLRLFFNEHALVAAELEDDEDDDGF